LIENLHVSKLAIANPDEGWNVAVKVQQRVHLHSTLTLTEASPGEHRQAEVDRCGVQSVSAQSEFLAEGIIQVERAGAAYDNLREVGEDAPVVSLVSVGQGGLGNPATDTHMVKLGGRGSQAGFDVTQALAVSKVSCAKAMHKN